MSKQYLVRMLVLVSMMCMAWPGQAMTAQLSDQEARRVIDMDACIEFLDSTGKLVRVKSEVDPEYELAGIAKKFEGDKCVLFEKVKGSEFPVLIGLLWNRDTVGELLGVPKERVPFTIASGIGP